MIYVSERHRTTHSQLKPTPLHILSTLRSLVDAHWALPLHRTPSQYVGQATVAQSGRADPKIRDNPSRDAMKQWSRCSLYTVDSLYAQSAGSH